MRMLGRRLPWALIGLSTRGVGLPLTAIEIAPPGPLPTRPTRSYAPKSGRVWPHCGGKRECERRRRQMAKIAAKHGVGER